ncbi:MULTISPECIES: DMT family transporter [Staphylococcaceae]|uniref:DMT family transporter n=1 Tax=Staphylococcaceae TaxID=90964 RepID=UPI000D1C7E66|nr:MULTISPECIES: DMT family transporter [Staphylococcaceae]MEB7852473.1 DMT family transporter [Staphylococcus equorum]PTE23905.1 EamA family transporter [Staphylococcus equorum]PTE27831.1 EamA family transporter [Staphylococcus equorum]QQB59100.1 DMT family transporter [Staphylococcus equorum]RIL98383.1 DMT family transporter [Staphylococcus equorum]
MNRKLLLWLFFILVCLVNGTTWGAQRIGLENSLPFWSSSIRFLISGSLISIVLLLLKKWKLPPKGYTLALFYGVFYFSVPFGAVYWGTQYVSSGLVSVLMSMLAVMLLVFNKIFGGIPATKMQIFGVLFSLFGIIIIFWQTLQFDYSPLSILSMLLILTSGLGSALVTIKVRDHLSYMPIFNFNAIAMIIGGIGLGIASLILENGNRSFHGPSLYALIYLSTVGSVIGLALYMTLLKHWHVSRASAHLFISPAIALYLGSLFLGETLNIYTYVGTVSILCGVMLINISPKVITVIFQYFRTNFYKKRSNT